MEVMQASPLKQQLDILWRPHPLLPAADCQRSSQLWRPGVTVREVLLANGIDPHQPIVIVLDDRLLTVAEWDTVCPSPGQIINVKAEVEGGGGGGGSNAVQVIAMVALVAIAIAAPYMAPAAWGLTATVGGITSVTMVGAMVTAGIMMAGSLVINSVFAANIPGNDLGANGSSGQYSQASPTYSLSGAQNRTRPYESMPVVMGKHRHVPDHGAKPFTEYHGEDQYLYQIFHLGLSTADRTDWKVGTNAITNYTDYSWAYQDANGKISAFPGNVDSAQGAVLENSAGWIVRTTSINTYRIGIDIEGTLYYANDRGGMDGTSVQLRVQYKPTSSGTWIDPVTMTAAGSGFAVGHYETYSVWVESGDWGPVGPDGEWGWIDSSHYESRTRFVAGSGGTVIVSGNSQAPRRATLFIDVPTGTYDVRVIRDTGDSSDARLQNKTNWSTLRSYQTDAANYVGQNRIGLTIRASEQLNGTISQMSYLADAYARYWNGSAWVWGKTSNPAHWFMDFAKGRYNTAGAKLYGVGLADDQIDLPALTAWANFCNSEGLTFNAIVDRNQSAADLLSAIARCGFASPTWASGKLGAVWDSRNASPVMAFGMSNIIRGSFEVSYITEQLAEEIIVRYVNPNKDWQQDEVRVSVPGVTTPTRSSTIDLYGCTSETMAGKFANYMAAQQYYRRRRVKWECDFEGFVCQRGDVALLSHDLTQWGYSGRVVSTADNTITLDRSVPRSGNTEYLMLKKPDGTMTTYSVMAATGDSDTLTLSAPPSLQADMQAMDHIWFFSPLATPGKKVKIVSVSPVSDSRVQVIATDEDPQFYSAWDGTWNSPSQSTLLLQSTPKVSNISISESLYLGTGGGIKSHVGVQWLASGSYDRAKIRYQIGTGPWISADSNTTSLEFDTDLIGTIQIQILPIYGSLQGETTLFTGYVYGIMANPPDVTNLTDFYRDGRTVISWRSVIDPRAIDYEIRKGASWAKGQVLGRVTGTEYITDGNGTYWVAAHTGTVYSANPVAITISGATLVSNVVATYDEEATGWPGAVSGGATLVGTDIVLAGVGLFSTIPLISAETSIFYYGGIAASGTYTVPTGHQVDIGHAQACSVSVSYRLRADNPFSLFSRVPSVAAMASVEGNFAGFADCKIQMAIAPDSGVFGDWRDFSPGMYVGRIFKFRAALSSLDPSVTAILDTMTFTVDMPDRIEKGTAVAVAAAGSTVTYSAPFQASPNVQITILNAQQGDDVVLTGQTVNGFTVQITNAGVGVARNINWLSQSY